MPSAELASGPTTSRLGANGSTPCKLNRPCVGLRPTTPQHAAGIRMEPPVSVPSAKSAAPTATATAEPLDEPPGANRGSSGLHAVPDHPLTPEVPRPSSCSAVLPTIAAP